MVFDLQRFTEDDPETVTGGDDTLTGGGNDSVESGGSSDSVSSGGSSSVDNIVFELIVQADEPSDKPEIGDEGCFNNVLEKLEDTQNSQTLRYQVSKQEKAAETTKVYSFGRF